MLQIIDWLSGRGYKPLGSEAEFGHWFVDQGVIVNTAETVKAIIAKHSEVVAADPGTLIAKDSRLDELGIDSLGMLEIVFDIEEQLDNELPFDVGNPEEYANATVGDLLGRIEALLARK